jgi:hypothetical protein
VINDEHPRCESCKYGVVVCHGSREDVYGCDSRRIENDAADALEAADKRIEELEKQHGNQLTRNIMLTAQIPKEGEWIREEHGHVFSNYYCSKCGAYAEDKIVDCEWNYCPNCGAKMRGEHDER